MRARRRLWTGDWVIGASLLIAVGGIVALVIFTVPGTLSVGETAQASVVIGLVLVTVFYAVSTHRMAKATGEQADASRKAEVNSARPIIKLALRQHTKSDLFCFATNIGPGPALNVEVWLRSEEVPDCKGSHNPIRETALGIGEQTKCGWHANDFSLPSPSSGFHFVATYADTFGRDFESRLERNSNGDWILQYSPPD